MPSKGGQPSVSGIWVSTSLLWRFLPLRGFGLALNLPLLLAEHRVIHALVRRTDDLVEEANRETEAVA